MAHLNFACMKKEWGQERPISPRRVRVEPSTYTHSISPSDPSDDAVHVRRRFIEAVALDVEVSEAAAYEVEVSVDAAAREVEVSVDEAAAHEVEVSVEGAAAHEVEVPFDKAAVHEVEVLDGGPPAASASPSSVVASGMVHDVLLKVLL